MTTMDPLEIDDSALEALPAEDVISWAVDRCGSQLTLACSFQDCVIVDLAVQVDPHLDVVFLDTGFHFPETLAYVEEVRRRYDLDLRVVAPGPEAGPWPCGSARCCELRKVAPLDAALAGRRGWMTAVKRCDSPARAEAPVASWDEERGMLKVNPLAAWSDDDVDRYIADRRLPVHPLVGRGYLSIGCWPTTAPVADGEDRRAGRWPSSAKTECGLHRWAGNRSDETTPSAEELS